MELNTILPYIIGIVLLYFLGKFLVLPIKSILKLIGNSILGAILIYIINLIGAMFNFHIGLNLFTIFFVAILGVPGAILLTLIKIFIIWKQPIYLDWLFLLYIYSTVTDFARFLGLSTSNPLFLEM